jgi:hypothetical protein
MPVTSLPEQSPDPFKRVLTVVEGEPAAPRTPATITLDAGDGSEPVTRTIEAFQWNEITGKISVAFSTGDGGNIIGNAPVLKDVWLDPALFLTIGTNRGA